MDVEDLRHRISNVIDQWAGETVLRPASGEIGAAIAPGPLEAPARVLPEGKRVVRTASSGDRVYLLDDVKKTRAWVTNPDVLDSLGFELGDVGEVTEDEMLKYQMSAALYKRVDG